MSDDARKAKPGPEPERLVIEADPAEALDQLLGKRESGLTTHELKQHLEAELPGIYCKATADAVEGTYQGKPFRIGRRTAESWTAAETADLRNIFAE